MDLIVVGAGLAPALVYAPTVAQNNTIADDDDLDAVEAIVWVSRGNMSGQNFIGNEMGAGPRAGASPAPTDAIFDVHDLYLISSQVKADCWKTNAERCKLWPLRSPNNLVFGLLLSLNLLYAGRSFDTSFKKSIAAI